MRNLMLTISYDGTCYHGYQTQEGCITIQEVMEKTLSEIMKEEISVQGCSRTDAGVHARRYVMNFCTSCNIPSDRVAIALNTKLPSDIVALSCGEVREEFNSRFDTQSKTYKYFINNSSYDVFKRDFQWYISRKLDVEKMIEASKHLVGYHPFDSFMAAGCQVKDTRRNINFLNVENNNGIIEITINADGYLYNMVRIIAGTLVGVGLGRFRPDEIKDIIEAKDRTKAGVTAPARGLYLWEVFYEEDKL
ncbi:MAG: tRNA pseudouridine(38-40) synthase TruA [Ruminococcaceae bacterium]|nr:tRNA pseudouridine(38-40) synthase TruA [Oscillospiraceae bacterium]